MFKRKFLTIFLLLMLTVTLTAGCSQAEQGFIALQKELTELNTYETSGDFVFSFNGLPAPSSTDPSSALLYNMIQKGLTVKFTGKTDMENNLIDCTFTLSNDLINTEQVVTRIICKNNILYVQIDELMKLAQVFGDTETSNKLKEVFGNAKYLSMTQEEYFKSLGIDEIQGQPLTKLNQNAFMNNKQTKLLQKFMLELPKAYQNYSTGLVTQNGNIYSWEVKGIEALEVLMDFLKYNLNNIKDVETWAVSFIDNLSDEETTLLGLDPQQKPLYKTLLNMVTTEIEMNKEEYLQGINDLKIELQENEEIKKFLNGFKMSCSLGKNEQEVYTNAVDFTMNFNEEDLQLGLQMKGQSQTKKTEPFTVNVPTTNVMTYTELLNKLNKTMEIQIDTNAYTLKAAQGNTQGNLEVKNIENQTYLPMRQIAEIFGEEVGWDSANNQAYVLRNGDKIDMTGVVIEGRTYIKTRDFTKLDYQVDWDEATRTVIISTTKL
ncbi:MAG: stalk domain-containing protein [Peptococcia bacterium]|jgi:hypothetical protein